KSFKVPDFYRSPLISKIKQFRRLQDPRKSDFSPSVLDFGPVTYYLARHFGFCYGVENAIEIAFRALEENPGKRLFLISEMIHNPEVNRDLKDRGVQFLHDTLGQELIPLSVLTPEDVVMIPAFGAPLSILEQLQKMGIPTQSYNTTCPFVERVWKKSEQIGKQDYTIIIHGKHNHEETRSTFSRAERDSRAVVVIRDLDEAKKLGEYVNGSKGQAEFESAFKAKFSKGFDVNTHLRKIGVINQTTMLASETEEIAGYFKALMKDQYPTDELKAHFADTRDTLCYATNENQDATQALLLSDADLAIVVGGYNSSNTSHLVELLEKKFPTYFISSFREILDRNSIRRFIYSKKQLELVKDYLPAKDNIRIILTSGASCPDSELEQVILRINSFFDKARKPEELYKDLKLNNDATQTQ
ncbi:MAG TPA: 4-hydroxy-3-methylbut-2-enyl diphosphate reductase, partial [Bacteroidia bacterium]|nr:4-hydroxy-3-methylbut-2-enyl diphosphate reductase [Bacteroidia bacterium]